VIPKAAPAGPAIAMETGVKARETKKSRLETRPRRPSGTRCWSRVPQITVAPDMAAPTVIWGTQTRGGGAVGQPAGEDGGPRGEGHHRSAAQRRAGREVGQRPERALETVGGEQLFLGEEARHQCGVGWDEEGVAGPDHERE
jgi:hypothetical protein